MLSNKEFSPQDSFEKWVFSGSVASIARVDVLLKSLERGSHMSKFVRRRLEDLRLVGGRFEENRGWLDFDVLPELLTYKRLLVETAKEEWKRRNPGRERLPKGFEENIHLAFSEVQDGSCVVPVERFIEIEDDVLDLYPEDEVDEAARLIDATVLAAQHDKPFPDRFPGRVIPIFAEWGRTLRPEEGIELGRNHDKMRPRFDAQTRERILATSRGTYEDRIDLVGEVRAATLKMTEGGGFTVLLEGGAIVEGVFTDEQEATITEALHKHHSVRVRIEGVAEFDGSGRIKKILRVDGIEERELGHEHFDPQAPPIWELISRIGSEAPEGTWRNVPTDLARNLEHYLYGTKKEGEE